jgi:hypothetical protein
MRITEKELNKIDDSVSGLKMKGAETWKILEINPTKSDQEKLWVSLELQVTLAVDFCDKLVNIEAAFDENLEEFKLLANFQTNKEETAIKM